MIPSSLSPSSSSSSSLESYGDELIAATRAYAAVANARTGDDAVAVADAANATREDVLAACARVDAEGTKVGLFFCSRTLRDDGGAARALLASLHDAHCAFTLASASYLRACDGYGTHLSSSAREAARGMTRAVCRATKSASASNGSANDDDDVRRGIGEIYAASERFKALPKTESAAIARELMMQANVVRDVMRELAALENEAETEAEAEDGDDLRFLVDDFDERELARARGIGVFAQACFALLRALIAPLVREKTADATALEPMVEAGERFRDAVEELGAGAYPPHDEDELVGYVNACVMCAKEMRACVVAAGGDESDAEVALAAFVAASEIVASEIIKPSSPSS